MHLLLYLKLIFFGVAFACILGHNSMLSCHVNHQSYS